MQWNSGAIPGIWMFNATAASLHYPPGTLFVIPSSSFDIANSLFPTLSVCNFKCQSIFQHEKFIR